MKKLLGIAVLLVSSVASTSYAMTLDCKLIKMSSNSWHSELGMSDESEYEAKRFTITIEGNKCAWGAGDFGYTAKVTERSIECFFTAEFFNQDLKNGIIKNKIKNKISYTINRYSGEAFYFKQVDTTGTDNGKPFFNKELATGRYSCVKSSKKF